MKHRSVALLSIDEFSEKEKSQENGLEGRKKDKTQRAMGAVKWNQLTALRSRQGGRYQTSTASLRGGRVR
ncbi:hypothetical protein, partial [Thiolapillus sp.]|uniref:hypothetical protein n=1 Tax=Thiolapillus sp. TaxID=2017437 RepID=UPI003AF84FFF